METVAKRPSPANVVIRIIGALAIALSTVMPAAFAFASPPAQADPEVRGPLAHLEAELDYDRAQRTASPFALFAQSTVSPRDTGHVMGVKYTFVDSAYAEGYTSLDELADADLIGNALVGQYGGHVSLYDFGSDEWLAAFVDTTRENGGSASLPLEVIFAKWDDTGTVYDFVQYDAEAGIAYVPKSFYYDEEGTELARSIQCQLVMPYSFDDDASAKVSAKVSSTAPGVKVATGTQTVVADAIEPDITIPVVAPEDAGKVSLSDFIVKGEDSDEPMQLVDGVNACYDSTTGELTLVNAPIASTTYDIKVANATGYALRALSADASTMNTWPWGKIENWGSGVIWREGDATEFPSYIMYFTDPHGKADPSLPGGTWGGFVDAVCASGAAYSCLGNAPGDYSAGSTNWLIERLLDGTSFAEVSGHLDQITPGSYDGGVFCFDGPATYNTGVIGLSDPAGHVNNPSLVGYCGHISRGAGYGSGSHTDWDTNNVHMRVLKVDESAGYVICGFVTPHKNSQTGVGVYKFRISKPNGTIDLWKHSADDSITTGNSNYQLNATYGIYRDRACTDKYGEFHLDGEGHSAMGNVPAGEYYVKELVAPAGYELDTETHVVTVKAAETTRVDLRDVPSKGNADIVKRSDAPDKTDGNPNYSLAGIVYNAYADEACTEKLDWWLTLDESGHAYKGNLALGTYWLKEEPASLVGKPFEVDKTAHRVDVKANATSYLKVTDHALFGSAEIVKTSSASNISDGNACYSYTGIRYDVFLDEACTRPAPVDTLVLDEKGKASVSKVPLGTYWLKEDPASVEGTGFKVNDKAYKLEVKSLNVPAKPEKAIVDEPLNDPLYIAVSKIDELTGEPSGSGPASLAGAEFEVRYWDNRDGSTAGAPTRTWTFQTDESGKIHMNLERYCVSGDELYRTDKGAVTYPLGTYSVIETKAPASYLLPDPNEPYVFQITDDFAEDEYKVGNTLDENGKAIYEAPIRHDFTFVKIDDKSQQRMAGIPFVVSRLDSEGNAIESHVVVTDDNGRYDSDVAAHSYKTNANDAAVTKRTDGSYAVDESKLVADGGLWFGIGEDGKYTGPDDAYGALPDSTTTVFRVEEVRCSGNAGRDLVNFTFASRGKEPSRIDLGTVVDHTPPSPEIGTTAMDASDEDRVISRDVTATIRDMVSMSVLTPGMSYKLVGTVIDKATGEALADAEGNPYSGTTSFTATTTNTARFVDITFDATLIADGGEVVVFEKLYDADGNEVASHEDPEDVGQTLRVKAPSIHTTATDAIDGDHVVASDVTATINDVVSYEGLVKGATYEMSGVLFNKTTGKPFVDAAGNFVTSKTEFVSTGDGSVTVTFEFDSTALGEETELVVFETLRRDGKVIAEHNDADDADQTVTVEIPEIGTTATDAADGDKVASKDVATTIDDEVAYQGLAVGKTYTVTGKLMDKATGEPFLDANGAEVTATKTFVPESANGTVTITFTFDSTNLEQTGEVVAFESVEREGRQIAIHADINDENQTVTIEVPRIGTTATDAADGDKIASSDTACTINDVVAYEGLVKGTTYELTGTLMDKVTGEPFLDAAGNPVTVKQNFVSEGSGTVTVAFAFDSTNLVENTDVVAFETVSREGRQIAIHADIDDEGQTVTIEVPRIGTTAVEAESGEHFAYPDEQLTIVDTVSYTGLVAGKAYEVDGTLMDKSTGAALEVDGYAVTSSANFVAQASSGSVEVEFTFDASALADSTLVAFETLYDIEGNIIAEHDDIDDESQTVEILHPGEPPIGTPFSKTGVLGGPLALLPVLIAGIGLVLIALSRKDGGALAPKAE